MNPNLKELMLKHGLHKYISEDCQHRMEMLAEVIVKDCVQHLDRNVIYEILCSDESPPKDNHWEGFVSDKIVTAMANRIKQHFGVEE